MIWNKLKKVIVPLIIIKIIIFLFFIERSELISISRDISQGDNNQMETESDSIVIKKQRLIRIVRNEEERGIIIKVREKKNVKTTPDDQRGQYNTKVD